jgi:hypothetical protein
MRSETLKRLSDDVRLPFGLRCHLAYLYHRRTWPGGRPVTVNQKIRWKMLKDRNPLLTTFADKLAVRDYVAERVGPEILPHLYAVVEDPDELDFDALPREFVLKPNHGSGAVWIVTTQAPPGGVLPVETWNPAITHPDKTDRSQVIAAARGWLASNMGREELEWCYIDIKPRLLVEELLPWKDGASPTEFKLWTFHGKVRMIRAIGDRFGQRWSPKFTPNWERLDVSPYGAPEWLRFPPDGLPRMIEIAETLAGDVDFVRVDFYDVDGRIVFGELTNYPFGGTGIWEPPSVDAWLGSWWQLD